MRILLDENIPGDTDPFLRAAGHEVIRAPRRTNDAIIATLADRMQAILFTRDRDFLTHLPSVRCGIVVIRIHPPVAETLISALQHLLDAEPVARLRGRVLILRTDGYEIIR